MPSVRGVSETATREVARGGLVRERDVAETPYDPTSSGTQPKFTSGDSGSFRYTVPYILMWTVSQSVSHVLHLWSAGNQHQMSLLESSPFVVVKWTQKGRLMRGRDTIYPELVLCPQPRYD